MDFAGGLGFLNNFDMFAPGGIFDKRQGGGETTREAGSGASERVHQAAADRVGLDGGEASGLVTVDKRGAVHTSFPSDEIIQASLANYRAVAGRARTRKFVNPAVLSRFPVEKGGPRDTIFGELVSHCKLLYANLDKSEDLPASIEATQARIEAYRIKRPNAKRDPQALVNKLNKDRSELAKAIASIEKGESELDGLIAAAREKLRHHMNKVIAKARTVEERARGPVEKAQGRLDAAVASNTPERRQTPLKKNLQRVEAAHAKAQASLDGAEKLLQETESLELLVTIQQQEWTIEHGEGKARESYQLASPMGGINTDRPDGYRHGGSVGFTDEDFAYAASVADIGLKGPEREAALNGAKKTLEAIRRHEGSSDSINTWDRAVLTFGPGLAAFGVLESVFAKVAKVHPGLFSAEIASLGIGIDGNVFTAKDRTSGRVLRGQDAKEYIASSPILLGAMRRVCGLREVREQMVVRTFETSIKRALTWSVQVDGPESLTGFPGKTGVVLSWKELTVGVDPNLVTAAQTVIASFVHASGNSQKLQSKIASEIVVMCTGQGTTVRELVGEKDSEARSALVRIIVNQVRDDTWAKAINDTVGEELAPLKPKREKKK